MTLFIIAQVLSGVYFLLTTVSVQFKKKRHMLVCVTLAALSNAFSYLLLGAYPAVATNLIAGTRTGIYAVNDDKIKSKKVSFAILLIFLLAIVIIGFKTYKDVYSLLPVSGTFVATIIYWQKKEKVIRFCSVYCVTVSLLYNIHVGAIVGAIAGAISLVSCFVAIYRYDIRKKTPTL